MTLVFLAAGMGSRFGGLKQIAPIADNNQIIIDYSLYDAKQAGFETVVFIIKKEIEAELYKDSQLNDFKRKTNTLYDRLCRVYWQKGYNSF